MREWLRLVAAVVALGALAGWWIQRQDAALAAWKASDAARADSIRDLSERADSLEAAYRVDTVTLWRTRRTTDTLTRTVEAWKHDTVAVVRYVTLADSTIRACTAALGTCEARLANADSLTDVWRARYGALAGTINRPRTALGLSYDALTGGLGVSVDRDLSRFRLGATVIPGSADKRLILRGSWWW